MRTSKILSRTAIGLVGSAAMLAAAHNILPSNQQKQNNNVEQTTNSMKDYGIPIAMGLTSLAVGVGAIVKRRQERIQEAAQKAELEVQNKKLADAKAEQERILNEKLKSHYGLNYTGEMKQTPNSVTKRDLRNYVERMIVILNTKSSRHFDSKSGKFLYEDERDKQLLQQAEDLTQLYMKRVKKDGCEDYLSEDFRSLNMMSKCFNYYEKFVHRWQFRDFMSKVLSQNLNCDDVHKIEERALKDLSEQIYSEADKSTSSNVLPKQKMMSLIIKELGPLSSLIDVDRLSNMMVLNAYKERDVLNRLAHTLAVTPWYELNTESFQ